MYLFDVNLNRCCVLIHACVCVFVVMYGTALIISLGAYVRSFVCMYEGLITFLVYAWYDNVTYLCVLLIMLST